ncbi:MFS general substrate transporter [Infundibulicybe gibba]|nr:MFS general substrate transporter [Infundibulicybe gibba]
MSYIASGDDSVHPPFEEKHALEAGSSRSSFQIDPVAERALVRKLDWALLPLFTLIYGVNFIDRTAIGNAKISGIEKDLGMEGFDFNIALTIFYISYILADIPSNLALKRYGSRWLAALVIAFGIIALFTAFVTSYAGLIITRIFLGFAEGGTLSGLTYIMARYYRRSELVFRLVFFMGVSAPLAGAFGGLLASGLLSIRDFGSIKSWRKIFLVEGIITTGFGLLCMIIIPADPQTSRMLRPEERELALARISADQPVDNHGKKEHTTMRLVLRSLNFNAIICTISYILINISFQGLSLFLPTVVSSLGHFTVVQSQLRTVPPYVVGAIWAAIVAYLSWHFKQRSSIVAMVALLQLCGYAIAIGTRNQHARYGGCFLGVAGSLSGPVVLAWGTDNAAPDTIRAVTTGLIPGLGAIGSVIAVWTYLPTDAPDFRKGNTLNLVSSVVILLLTLIYAIYIRVENARRERGGRDYRLEGITVEEERELGYLHPKFRYQI